MKIKAWMSLDDSMVDDSVDVQLLLHCKDPATDVAVSRSPLCTTPMTTLWIFICSTVLPSSSFQMGAARLDNKGQITKGQCVSAIITKISQFLSL